MSGISFRTALVAVVACSCSGEALGFSGVSGEDSCKTPISGVFHPGDYSIVWNTCSKPCGGGERIGHVIWKWETDGSSDFGRIDTLKYPETYSERELAALGGRGRQGRTEWKYVETKCLKSQQPRSTDLIDGSSSLRYLLDDNFEISDDHPHLRDSLLRSMPGHVYEKCNPDPCPSDSTVDNLLETLNGILTDAGNPNLKLCPA